MLQSPQPPPTESILAVLLNEITTVPDDFVLVLDDYHVIDTRPVDTALAFLVGRGGSTFRDAAPEDRRTSGQAPPRRWSVRAGLLFLLFASLLVG